MYTKSSMFIKLPSTFSELHMGATVAEWLHSCLPPLRPGFDPHTVLSGKAGSCLPLVGSLQYRTLTNCMYWFPLPFQLPIVIWPVQCWKRRKTPSQYILDVMKMMLKIFYFGSFAVMLAYILFLMSCHSNAYIHSTSDVITLRCSHILSFWSFDCNSCIYSISDVRSQ